MLELILEQRAKGIVDKVFTTPKNPTDPVWELDCVWDSSGRSVCVWCRKKNTIEWGHLGTFHVNTPLRTPVKKIREKLNELTELFKENEILKDKILEKWDIDELWLNSKTVCIYYRPKGENNWKLLGKYRTFPWEIPYKSIYEFLSTM